MMDNSLGNAAVENQIRRKTIRSFILFGIAIAAAWFAWKWLLNQPSEQNALQPLRTVMNTNEKLFSSILNNEHLVTTYPVSEAVKHPKVNGNLGLNNNFNPNEWKLKIIRSEGDTIYLSMDDIKSFPKTSIVFDFKCIEGWSQKTHWAGARFSDVAAKYNLGIKNAADFKSSPAAMYQYAGLLTPDSDYYVGIDMASMLHPQTLLCYEMNGNPLPMNQGFPLRLIIPVKYGIKNIKRIGTVFFSDHRPKDYWAERGYDYYSGL
jgi:DMSO/TMAO reductase YedYZ molybdopterin-dependent catalytic subunit